MSISIDNTETLSEFLDLLEATVFKAEARSSRGWGQGQQILCLSCPQGQHSCCKQQSLKYVVNVHVISWCMSSVLCRRRDVGMLLRRQLVLLTYHCLRRRRVSLRCRVTRGPLAARSCLLWVCRHWTIWKQMVTVIQVLLLAALSTVCHRGTVTVSPVYFTTHTPAVMQLLISTVLINRLMYCHNLRINSLWWMCLVSGVFCFWF